MNLNAYSNNMHCQQIFLNMLWIHLAKLFFVPQFCTDAGLTASNGEARRSIKAGAFKVNGEKYGEENLVLEDGMIVQVGKRKFIKIKFN